MSKFILKHHQPKIETVSLRDGQTMPVLTCGNASLTHEPVVLVHGFGMEAGMWLPFVLPLAHKYRFYMPYLRGFGQAAHTPFSQADFVKQYAEDIQDMREQLKLERMKLAGISMGALTSLMLNKIGGFGGISHYMHIDQSPVMHNHADWQWGVMGEDNAYFLGKLKELVALTEPELHKDFEDVSDALKTTMIRTTAIMVGRSFASTLKHLGTLMNAAPLSMAKLRDTAGWQQQMHIVKGYIDQDYDLRDSLPDLTAKTTVVIGGQSRLYDPRGQQAFADMLSSSEVKVIENAGHAVPADAPLAFYRVFKAFLAQV